MPIYEFECKCGEKLEKLVSKPIKTTKCLFCGGRMHRIVSASNFQLKGTGWARDGYGLKKETKKKQPKNKKDK